MIQILHVTNPFQPHDNLIREIGHDGQTIREWLKLYYGPEFEEFDRPTLCQLNGQAMMRADWDSVVLSDGDGLVFITLPGEVVTIIIAIIAIVVAVVAVLLVSDPRIPQEAPAPDSVYTLRGQNNRFRPNEPVEVVYGKCKVWPTFLTRPYARYIGNQQYQFSLFCLGQGDHEIHEKYFDDTPLSAFDEVELELVPPGSTVTLIDAAVYAALEVSNIELLGPNEDDYVGVSGPFTINDYDKPVHRIEMDVSFPQGLYSVNDDGKLTSMAVELLFEYREIDEDGDPVGSWTTHTSTTVTRNDNTPQRITFSQSVTAGRYQVRGRRITNKPDSTRKSSQVRWEQAKGYAKLDKNFGDVYIIAMKALATNQLNDQTSKSFNVSCTRKLKTWDPVDGWGPRVATRNPVWAMCDVFRANYGAKLTTQYLDMDALYDLAGVLEGRNDNFDWVFDEPITVWEAAKTIMRVGRSTPIPQGSIITAVRDKRTSLVSGVFNQYNIVKGSLSKSLQMFEFQPFDGLKIEYTDADTWKLKEVDCILPGREGLNLDRLRLPGCTNRNRAYREGLYIQARRELQRKTVTFQTGLEGHIPTYMDLISITHDTVRVGQGGMVLAYNTGTNEMTLSEQVEFGSPHLQHVIALRGPDGAIMGDPIVVTPGSAANKVILAHDPDETLDFSIDQVPPLYAFGITDIWSFMGKVVSVRPMDQKTVEITALNYVDQSYDYDDGTAIDVPQVSVIRDPKNPQVEWITITPVPDNANRVYVDFPPVTGAASYILQTTYDGTNWSPAGTYPVPPVMLAVNPGTLKVRVAPFAIGGNVIWRVSDEFVVGSNIAVPGQPQVPTQPDFTGLTATAQWLSVTGSNGYNVDIYIPGGGSPLRTVPVGTALEVSYTRAEFETDSPLTNSRSLEFHVTAFNEGGSGAARIITRTNPVPVAPTTLAVGSPSGSNYPGTWAYTPQGDEVPFKIYGSTTMGFTPGPGNLLGTSATLGFTIAAPVRPYYWRVASGDVWGTEQGMSAESVIP